MIQSSRTAETSVVEALVIEAPDLQAIERALESDSASGDSGTRHRIVAAMVHRADLKPASLLTRLLVDDPSSDVRAGAARALGELQAVEAEDALLHALNRDLEQNVALRAAQALACLRSQRAVPSLIGLLGDDQLGVRVIAARALSAIDDIEARKALRQAVDDRRRLVAYVAVEALSRGGDAEDAEFLRSAAARSRWRRKRMINRALDRKRTSHT